MLNNFHESYAADAVPMPSDRSTGLVLAAAMALFGLWWRKTGIVLYPALFMAFALASMAIACPSILAPLTAGWFRFGLLLHRIVSPVVMFIIFALVIVPFGLLMQTRRDPLQRKAKADPAIESYWLKAGTEATAPPDMRRQF